MISLSAQRAFKAYHFEVPHNLSKNDFFKKEAILKEIFDFGSK